MNPYLRSTGWDRMGWLALTLDLEPSLTACTHCLPYAFNYRGAFSLTLPLLPQTENPHYHIPPSYPHSLVISSFYICYILLAFLILEPSIQVLVAMDTDKKPKQHSDSDPPKQWLKSLQWSGNKSYPRNDLNSYIRLSSFRRVVIEVLTNSSLVFDPAVASNFGVTRSKNSMV